MKRESVESLIDLIREKPNMYIGESSIMALRYFLFGYYFALYENYNNTDFCGILEEYQNWLGVKYTNKNAIQLGWAGLLLLKSNGDESVAFDLFWQEWDEFLSQRE